MDDKTARTMGAEYLIRTLLALEANRSPDLMPMLRATLLESIGAPRRDEADTNIAQVSQAAYDIAFPLGSPRQPPALRLAWPPQPQDGQSDS